MQTMLLKLLSWYRQSVRPLMRSARLDDDDEFDGPRSGVRVPLRSGPGGRRAAVALAEPNEVNEDVNAVGRLPRPL